ncbi:MAG: glycerate kinase [Acidimicrobiales bacterium]
MPRVVAAPDKFRGTATAGEVAAAIAEAARRAGWECDQVPVSDGGEGFAEVLGGAVHRLRVHGPLGELVEAEWRLLEDGRTAVVEMARASGLSLVGGAEANDPVRADTTGTGELIAAAVKAGAGRLLVGMGGSASTDGGWAALQVLEPHSRLRGVELLAACDVTTRFVDAAATFAPQKGATPAQVRLLTRRLERLVQLYQERFGVDVADVAGAGAAGGLAGGLVAIGASVVGGFDAVAETVDLAGALEGADLVITGEGFLDEQSFHGKAVGGVAALAAEAGVAVVVIAGEALEEQPVPYRSLVERFGTARAFAEPLACVTELAAEELAARS